MDKRFQNCKNISNKNAFQEDAYRLLFTMGDSLTVCRAKRWTHLITPRVACCATPLRFLCNVTPRSKRSLTYTGLLSYLTLVAHASGFLGSRIWLVKWPFLDHHFQGEYFYCKCHRNPKIFLLKLYVLVVSIPILNGIFHILYLPKRPNWIHY